MPTCMVVVMLAIRKKVEHEDARASKMRYEKSACSWEQHRGKVGFVAADDGNDARNVEGAHHRYQFLTSFDSDVRCWPAL